VSRMAPRLDEQKLKRPLGEWGAASIFKVATALLVALSLGPAWLNAWQIVWRRQPSFTAVPPANEQPLWTLELDPSDRRAPEAARLAEQGDEAVFDANLDLAQARYEEAWRAAPSAELALKLGEVAYQQNRLKEAAGWWRRHRRDAPGSKAKAFLDRLPPDTAEVR